MNTIHIVHGSLQRTRKLPPGQCVTLTDDLTDGILHRDRYQNQRLRTAHSGFVVRDLELVREAAAELRSFDELIIWAGPAHRDQLMLAWLVPWLRALQVPGSALRLACPENRREQPVDVRQAESSDLMRGYMTRRPIDPTTDELTVRLWDAVTSDTPNALLAFEERELAPLPHWITTRDAFLARYPDATGLGFHDRVLLNHCAGRWRSAAKVVAQAVEYAEDLAPMTPQQAWKRLLRLVGHSRSTGAVSLRTEGHLVPEHSEVCLTDLGVQGVEGSVDMLTRIPLCEWIGGTLIVSPERMWRWTDAGLVPDHSTDVMSDSGLTPPSAPLSI